ncbi:MAG: hypothetical protein WC530_11270, partial [Candidatus Omnitrophota bacterium]
MFEHEFAGGLVLGVKGIEADRAAIEIELVEKGACNGDLVGLLGGHDGAAQIELGLGGDGGDHGISASVFGFFPVDVDEFGGVGFPSGLALDLQDRLFEFFRVDAGHETAECGLGWRGVIFASPSPDAQCPALAGVEACGKLFQILLSARRTAEVRQEHDGQQAPGRVVADAPPIVGQIFEVPDEGADFLGALGRTCRGFRFHARQPDLARFCA